MSRAAAAAAAAGPPDGPPDFTLPRPDRTLGSAASPRAQSAPIPSSSYSVTTPPPTAARVEACDTPERLAVRPLSKVPPPRGNISDATLRLFESTWFNMAMAISYLWTYRVDDDVQQYICERMKAFDSRTIEFWLPQLIANYINLPTESKILTPLAAFIVERSTRYIRFATVTCWWLEAMCNDGGDSSVAKELLDHIEKSRPQFPLPLGDMELPPATPPPAAGTPTSRKKHRRTRSSGGITSLVNEIQAAAPTTTSDPLVTPQKIGELSGLKRAAYSTEDLLLDSGHAFMWPRINRSRSVHFGLASMGLPPPKAGKGGGKLSPIAAATAGLADDDIVPTLAQCMKAQRNFVGALLNIAFKLVQYESKEVRRIQLFAELALLNLNLPARVYLPLCESPADGSTGVLSPARKSTRSKDHHVVRFPPQEAALLNSRDRVPYLVYVEVLGCDNSQTAPLPAKLTLVSQESPGKASLSARRDAPSQAVSAPPSPSGRGDGTAADAAADDEAAESAPLMCAAADGDVAKRQGFVNASEIRRNLTQLLRVPNYSDKKDPSAMAFKEPWRHKVERIRRSSPYGHLPNWHLVPIIIKSGDDLRQELLGSQLMSAFRGAWAAEKVALWIRPLQILVASHDGGLIEVVGSAVSIHQIKRNSETLHDYFLTEFGPATSERFLAAQRNFAESLAGYSLFCYFAQVKDRHNSNILVDGDGHILHIDLGFMLSASNSPGGGINFERAPFKLTSEYLQVLGGEDSDMLQYFRILVLQGFIAARKHCGSIASVIQAMIPSSQLPCLKDETVLQDFEERFQMSLTEEKLVEHVNSLMTASLDSARTFLYDRFQYYSNGIRE
mmetsp:Transcript_25965/g.68120  ORF Transcript_25965/g.68120 Transcript_25965/m.68120 type:complete len:843 (+) Transcript_25965:185-2713(+)